MSDNGIISDGSEWGVPACAERSARPPPEFIELVELRSASLEHRLGYFRDEPFVIFGYCPGGGEVIWKDGHSSGFGTGGWKSFLWEIAPLAARRGAFLGDERSAGTHVLWVNRLRGAAYAAPREMAEDRLARVNETPAPRRRCLCALIDCASCPIYTCRHAGAATSGGPGGTGRRAPHGSHRFTPHESPAKRGAL